MPTPSPTSTTPSVPYFDPSLPQSTSSFDRAPNPDSETSLPGNDVLDDEEIDLTEEELRELYDTEEINRFVGLFSAFVTEVQVKDFDSTKHEDARAMDKTEPSLSSSGSGPSCNDSNWTSFRFSEEPSPPLKTSTPVHNASLSEVIAYRYLVPNLPPARPEMPPFTLGRLRLILQRLYLATVPIYGTFLQRLLTLATWESPSTSLLYCTLYWMLWWKNLLVSALVLRILYSLLKRRIFPYPTLDDLRRHREEVLRADEFGQQMSERLSSASSAVTELWRLFKFYDLTNKSKARAKGKAKNMNNSSRQFDSRCVHSAEDPTMLDGVEDSEVAKDIKRVGLRILENVAEFHERARNIFHWRRSTSSQKYAILILLVFLLTLMPARYISKILLFIPGVFFWHVIPIIASLPPSERDRVFVLLNDVPTDSEYAMELIAQRVAGGLPVNPPKPSKAPKKHFLNHIKAPVRPHFQIRGHSMDWKKLGDAVAVGKSAFDDVKRLKLGNIQHLHENWSLKKPPVPSFGVFSQTESSADTRTYPCQHSSGPGLITLTQSTLLFTLLMSQTPKIVISLASVKGLKKAGILKGLHIRWYNSLDSPDGLKELKEDKFAWVGGRDELFARLVSSEGKHWITI